MVTATLNVSNWTLFRASFMSSKWESIESTVRCTVSMLFYCICVGMVFTAGTTPASTIWNGNSRWSAFYDVRPSFCTKIIFTIYQTFCSFFSIGNHMLDSQMSGHLIVKKSALAEKHGSEWKMLEFISFCAIYSLPIWFFPWWIFMHSNPFTKE